MATTQDAPEQDEDSSLVSGVHPKLGEFAKNLGIAGEDLLDYAERAAEESYSEEPKFTVKAYTDILEDETEEEYGFEEVESILCAAAQISDRIDGAFLEYESTRLTMFKYREDT